MEAMINSNHYVKVFLCERLYVAVYDVWAYAVTPALSRSLQQVHVAKSIANSSPLNKT